MKKTLKIFILIPILFVSYSCEDLLDINEDPLAATDVQFSENPELLFTRIQAELGAERILESGNVFLFFTQTLGSAGSAGVFIDPEQYVVPDFPQIVSWGTYYINLLKNITLGIDLSNQGGQPNLEAIYKIARVFVHYHITTTWENAPYTQANKLDIEIPEFDDQETQLRGLVADLDDAIATFDANDPVIMNGGQDFIYDGDIDSWIRFANSLKLKILMMIVNRDPSVAGQIGDLVNNQPLVDQVQYNAFLPFGSDITNANQLWKLHNQFAGGTSAFLNGTTTIIDMLDGADGAGDGTGTTADDDPRLATYFDEGTGADPDEYIGTPPGAADNFTNIANLSLNVIRPEEPDRWMEAGYITLLKAEAVARGFASGDANALYRQGISLAMDSYDGTPGEIADAARDAYIAGLPNPTVEDIQMQGYLALFMRGVETWEHVRRTGMVDDFPVPLGAQLSDIIRRLPYAPDARTSNPNTPPDPILSTPMWFEPTN